MNLGKKRKAEDEEPAKPTKLTSKEVCTILPAQHSRHLTFIWDQTYLLISIKLLHLNRKEDWSVPRKWRKWGSAIMKRTMSRTRIRTEKCPWMAKMPNELSDNTSIAVSKAMSVARLERLVWIHSDLGKSKGSVDLWYNCSNALYSYCGTSHRPEHSNYSLTANSFQYSAFSALLT